MKIFSKKQEDPLGGMTRCLQTNGARWSGITLIRNHRSSYAQQMVVEVWSGEESCLEKDCDS